MKILLILVILVMAAGLIGTLSLSGKGDEDYSSSTKSNIARLTLIYVGLAVALMVGIGLYVAL
ncbi:hypothetical protein HT574_05505 [Parageobacillus sp. VR-IP]|jgi:cell division protein FtsW (lipid II flippase)|uniref:Uncharacterized protein n=2 Tax=Saccharococcus caldoxylosilyticus TaxID=81408 RepID=A0A023DEN3_9BACL|nr:MULTISPECIES: hypothetical protein [Parageobacillus]OQP04938.1 hypothetical protein BSK33_02085 [Geobacillus sp. 44B]KYD12151.1 hypothetical protein B4119_3331 [Parageobacillus caldoxylosilyticus]MBB3852211.1 cell division protein FtsW (lipid II flippase) [Parageobacillus caldoxylosilyticus]NUK29564.1 hypothetical protein [Parageobacillus sp. VR-IP]QNU39188.1 hypothetical protein IC801_08465 [Geobacillus sp. 44B]